MNIFQTLKLIFSKKALLNFILAHLDALVPMLAGEIEKVKDKVAEFDSTQKAQWVIDKAKDYLRAKLG